MESVLLAALGGVLGAAIALAGLRLVPALTADLPRLDEVALDYRALLFVAAVTALSAILSGLPQAWRRTRVAPWTGLSGGSLRTTDGRRPPLPPRRHRRQPGGDRRGLDAGFRTPGSQLPSPSQHRSRLRSPRRPRGSDFPRQPGVQQRQSHADLLSDVVRASAGGPGRHCRRRRDDGADQPARAGLRAPCLAARELRRTARSGCPRPSGWSRPDTFRRSGCGLPTGARWTIATSPHRPG